MTGAIIVSRTDRAGDLILTTPVLRELAKAFPETRIIAHVRKYTSALLRLCNFKVETIIDENYSTILDLARKFKEIDADRIIIVHPSARTIFAARLAGIPKRTGRASNIWQFLLNDRRIQKRSKNQKHEYEYNLELLEGIVKNPSLSAPELKPDEGIHQKAFEILKDTGLHKPVIIHPGHGGSAYNLSVKQYMEIAEKLTANNIPVLVSLGPGEEHLEAEFSGLTDKNCRCLKNIPDFAVLAGVFSMCAAFTGGSTGPMHLASTLGIPVVTFFPPVFAMTPKRWGPTGSRTLVIKPEPDDCDAMCDRCKYKGCMQGIDLQKACNWLIKQYELSITD